MEQCPRPIFGIGKQKLNHWAKIVTNEELSGLYCWLVTNASTPDGVFEGIYSGIAGQHSRNKTLDNVKISLRQTFSQELSDITNIIEKIRNKNSASFKKLYEKSGENGQFSIVYIAVYRPLLDMLECALFRLFVGADNYADKLCNKTKCETWVTMEAKMKAFKGIIETTNDLSYIGLYIHASNVVAAKMAQFNIIFTLVWIQIHVQLWILHNFFLQKWRIWTSITN